MPQGPYLGTGPGCRAWLSGDALGVHGGHRGLAQPSLECHRDRSGRFLDRASSFHPALPGKPGLGKGFTLWNAHHGLPPTHLTTTPGPKGTRAKGIGPSATWPAWGTGWVRQGQRTHGPGRKGQIGRDNGSRPATLPQPRGRRTSGPELTRDPGSQALAWDRPRGFPAFTSGRGFPAQRAMEAARGGWGREGGGVLWRHGHQGFPDTVLHSNLTKSLHQPQGGPWTTGSRGGPRPQRKGYLQGPGPGPHPCLSPTDPSDCSLSVLQERGRGSGKLSSRSLRREMWT